MKKYIIYLFVITLFFSCSGNSKQSQGSEINIESNQRTKSSEEITSSKNATIDQSNSALNDLFQE